jgi:hypothetical protein
MNATAALLKPDLRSTLVLETIPYSCIAMDTPNSPDPRAGDGAIPTPLSRNESSGGIATASRVGAFVHDFVAQRNAGKDQAFSYVLAWAGRLFAGGMLWYMAILAPPLFTI